MSTSANIRYINKTYLAGTGVKVKKPRKSRLVGTPKYQGRTAKQWKTGAMNNWFRFWQKHWHFLRFMFDVKDNQSYGIKQLLNDEGLLAEAIALAEQVARFNEHAHEVYDKARANGTFYDNAMDFVPKHLLDDENETNTFPF